MSVIVKGRKMPENCWDCPFCDDYDFLDPYHCSAAGKDFDDGIDKYENCRAEWCPLEDYREEEER